MTRYKASDRSKRQAAEVAASAPPRVLKGYRLKNTCSAVGVKHPEFDGLLTDDHLANPTMIAALKVLDRQGKAKGWWDRHIEEVYE